MIEVVKTSSLRKPQIQRLGDVVSSWFVPIVILFSIFTFLMSHFCNLVFRISIKKYSRFGYFMSLRNGISYTHSCGGWVGSKGVLVKGGDTFRKTEWNKIHCF